MIEKYQNLSTGQLQARLDKILPTISLLTDVWNNQTLQANVIAAWNIGTVQDERIRVIDFAISQEDDSFDDFLLFIHNYCTKLCAEKLVLQFLIEQKTADIANP